ncbi:hypothetical protein [Rhizobium rhizogenes]
MKPISKSAVWIWGNFDKFLIVGPLLLSFIGTAWVSYLTLFMSSYSPLSWVAAGLFGLLIVSLVCWLGTQAYSKLLIAKRTAGIIAETNVNPLDEKFDHKKIRLIDFYSPQYISHKNKDFRNCHLAGPGLVYFVGGLYAEGIEFRQVQVVIAKTNSAKPIAVFGITVFENCKFVGGAFTELTMLMSKETYDSMPAEIRNYLPVISDGI